MKTTLLAAILALPVFTSCGLHAAELSGVPNTFTTGTMYMPMISVDYVEGSIMVMPDSRIPVMKSLQGWSAGSWFEASAPWRADLGSPAGVGGTPLANAGNGSLFTNQYGFMYDSMAGDLLEGDHSFAIEMVSASEGLQAFFYSAGTGGAGVWDQIWQDPGDRVVWSTAMWHNYFVLPADAAPGIYTMTFEIYLVDYLYAGEVPPADYSSEAMLNAERVAGIESAYLTYQFEVIPEPSTWMLMGAAGALFAGMRQWRRRQA